MSKGFGRLQIQIIQYTEKNHNFFTRDLIKCLVKATPSPAKRSSIYASLKRLREDRVIVPSRTRNLWDEPKYRQPVKYMLNKENPKYLDWKKH